MLFNGKTFFELQKEIVGQRPKNAYQEALSVWSASNKEFIATLPGKVKEGTDKPDRRGVASIYFTEHVWQNPEFATTRKAYEDAAAINLAAFNHRSGKPIAATKVAGVRKARKAGVKISTLEIEGLSKMVVTSEAGKTAYWFELPSGHFIRVTKVVRNEAAARGLKRTSDKPRKQNPFLLFKTAQKEAKLAAAEAGVEVPLVFQMNYSKLSSVEKETYIKRAEEMNKAAGLVNSSNESSGAAAEGDADQMIAEGEGEEEEEEEDEEDEDEE